MLQPFPNCGVYNCQAFSSDQIVTTNGDSRLVRGICDGILGWFASDDASSDGITLTWDPAVMTIVTNLNIPPLRTLVSCDEFPFGGAEEDGKWGAMYATRKRPPSANCVPQWQQTLQGNCNGILSTLYTNVPYFDRDSGSTTEDWKLWSKRTLKGQPPDERSTPGGREGDPTRLNGKTPAGPSATTSSANFTFALAYATSLSDTPDQWGMALNNFEMGTTTSTTASTRNRLQTSSHST
ncbi:hypothetical protein EYZ11_005163 [Aspergillus tanneri]|uniref:Uncharacterized protein n=1 Tax=Aspergillus tanneri TaxID=1220188 RepID=A0A4S3JIK8_9EURO|nr:hypothetical protein EYZ11_005163 [Aspergillus tanneri]